MILARVIMISIQYASANVTMSMNDSLDLDCENSSLK